jgi:4a-hydroxytetrahydrobiopterin dehydratase
VVSGAHGYQVWYDGGMETLSDDQIRTALADDLPGWKLDGGAIHRRYQLDSFTDAIAFITRVAAKAEAANHHPDLHNSYRTVEVSLTSHDAGGVTDKDLALAREIAAIATT